MSLSPLQSNSNIVQYVSSVDLSEFLRFGCSIIALTTCGKKLGYYFLNRLSLIEILSAKILNSNVVSSSYFLAVDLLPYGSSESILPSKLSLAIFKGLSIISKSTLSGFYRSAVGRFTLV